MLELTATRVGVGVTDDENGEKVLHVIDEQSGIVLHIPFNDEAAKKIGAALSGSSVIVAPAEALRGLNADEHRNGQ